MNAINLLPGLTIVAGSLFVFLTRKQHAQLVEKWYREDRHLLWRLGPSDPRKHELNIILVAIVLFVTGVVAVMVGIAS